MAFCRNVILEVCFVPVALRIFWYSLTEAVIVCCMQHPCQGRGKAGSHPRNEVAKERGRRTNKLWHRYLGLDDLPTSIAIPDILWFCVILCCFLHGGVWSWAIWGNTCLHLYCPYPITSEMATQLCTLLQTSFSLHIPVAEWLNTAFCIFHTHLFALLLLFRLTTAQMAL